MKRDVLIKMTGKTENGFYVFSYRDCFTLIGQILKTMIVGLFEK